MPRTHPSGLPIASAARAPRPSSGWVRAAGAVILVIALFAAACSSDPTPSAATDGERYLAAQTDSTVVALDVEPAATAEPTPQPVEPQAILTRQLVPEVLSVRDHDRDAFTQGLEIVDGRMFESTGSPGMFPASTTSVREVDPESGDVLRKVDFGREYFGEGLAVVDDLLIQLSWKAGRAFILEKETFEVVGEFKYETEGWGLCFDGTELIMSDGSGNLYFRDPSTFALNRTVEILRNGGPVQWLNELECVDGRVWANVFGAVEILEIDPRSGAVVSVVDAAELAAPFVADNGNKVLNGIAFDEETGNFIITGKNWDEMYEVRFVDAG